MSAVLCVAPAHPRRQIVEGGEPMRADAHRQAALDIEQSIADMGDPALKPFLARVVIEAYWGAALHWIAYRCEGKFGRHRETEARLATYLRDLGEPAIARFWQELDERREGGVFGPHAGIDDVNEVIRLWQDNRAWAAYPNTR